MQSESYGESPWSSHGPIYRTRVFLQKIKDMLVPVKTGLSVRLSVSNLGDFVRMFQRRAARYPKIGGSMIPESQLFDYMRTSSHAASIKSPESGEYIFSNAENTKLMGFGSTDDLMGLTVRDLNFSRSQRGSAWAEKIQEMDYLSRDKKCNVEDTHEYINENGMLAYKTTAKLPLLGIRGNVLGIVTFSWELTHRLSHRLLYRLYKNNYGKKIAAKKFLHHLEIESWFYVPPTEAELLALIERAAGKVDKDIARAHGVSTRTIETHFVNLRAKLKGALLHKSVYRAN